MKLSPMAELPLNEYENRIKRLTELMKEKSLDGMMISNRENTRYYSDLQSIIWSSKVSTPGILLVNADGETAMIGSASAVETARHTCVLDNEDVTCYNRNALPGIPATYPDAIAAAFRKLGIDKGSIGMEFGEGMYLQLQWHWYQELEALLPNARFVDAADIIMSHRMVKSAAERDLLRHVCQQNEAAIRFALENTTLGETTELEFFRLYAQEAFRSHCENVTNDLIPLSVRFGSDRFALEGCPCGNTVISGRPNANLIVSGGLYTNGYYSNLLRTAFVGAMSEQQAAMQQVANEAAQLAIQNIRDGADIRTVTEQVDRFALASEAAGAYLSRGDLGFSVGLDLKEPPYLRRAAMRGECFKAGMVLSIQPRFGTPELGMFSACAEIAVTDTGAELLSSADAAPFIL